MTDTKKIKVYPYRCVLSGTQDTPQNLKELFKESRLNENIIAFSEDYPLLLIVDKTENDLVFGRFFLLGKEVLDKLNATTKMFSPIPINIDEYIARASHFLWDLRNKIIFSEYNFFGVRHFINPLKNYLDKKFNVEDNIVEFIEIRDTFKRFKEDRNGYTKITVRVAQRSLEQRETGSSFLKNVLKISPDASSNITITIGRDRKNVFLYSDEVIKVAGKLKEDEGIRRLDVETANSVYDLLHNNMFEFKAFIKCSAKNQIDKADVYEKLKGLYQDEISQIKSMLSSGD